MAPTPSQSNAQSLRTFIPTLHESPYPAIDPSLTSLPNPYIVCIIGARGAIGSGLARSYARAGISGLVLAARTLTALREVEDEVRSINPSIKTVVVQCDITSAESVSGAAASTREAFGGRLDVVVVNAGYTGALTSDITVESPAEFQHAFNVQAIGTFHVAHNFIPLLRHTPDGAQSFLTISSMSALTVSGPVAHIHYCASKMAQVRVVEMVYEQHAKNGLFVASVHPGGVKSGFGGGVLPDEIAHMMRDSPDLAGAFCVWLTNDRKENKARRDVLNGRFFSCKWDVNELTARLDEIKEKDLLRFRMAV